MVLPGTWHGVMEAPEVTQAPRDPVHMLCLGLKEWEDNGLVRGWMISPDWHLSLLSAGGAQHPLCRLHNKG